jgi:hypothetical protein
MIVFGRRLAFRARPLRRLIALVLASLTATLLTLLLFARKSACDGVRDSFMKSKPMIWVERFGVC